MKTSCSRRNLFARSLIFALSGLLCWSLLGNRQTIIAQSVESGKSVGFSVQAALDAHPGQAVQLPPGDLVLIEPIRIRHNGSSLCGPGRLIQSNQNAPFAELRDVRNVALRSLSLVRPEGSQEAAAPAILVQQCEFVTLEGLDIQDTRSTASVIRFENSRHVNVERCQIRDYMTLSVDDRTSNPHFGYAFNCIDGTGICITQCRDVLLLGNRILEEHVKPTREFKEEHQLGKFVKRTANKGDLVNQATWDSGSVNNWHQGSAIVVTDPENTAYIRILGNHIENAAQGIDIHADCVTVSGNIVVNSFMGMKAMHGSRNILIANNQFIRNDLWSIGLMPGTASHATRLAGPHQPAQAANVDGGSIIANNIISQFGYGDSHWIWDPQQSTCANRVGPWAGARRSTATRCGHHRQRR